MMTWRVFIIAFLLIFLGLVLMGRGADSFAGAMSIHMVEQRGVTAARALQKSININDMKCHSVRVMAPKSGFIIECHSSTYDKPIGIQWWLAYAIDGELTALAPLNGAAQSVAPPNGTPLKPWSDLKFARLIELKPGERVKALEVARKSFETLKR